jgi:hypothetical protein
MSGPLLGSAPCATRACPSGRYYHNLMNQRALEFSRGAAMLSSQCTEY